jgi:flagellar motor switch protein FliN
MEEEKETNGGVNETEAAGEAPDAGAEAETAAEQVNAEVPAPEAKPSPAPAGKATDDPKVWAFANMTASVLSSIIGSISTVEEVQEADASTVQLPPYTCQFNLAGAVSDKYALVLDDGLVQRLLKHLVGGEAASQLAPGDPARLGALNEVVTQLGAAWAQHFSETDLGEVTISQVSMPETPPPISDLGGSSPVAVRFLLVMEGEKCPFTALVSNEALRGAKARKASEPPPEQQRRPESEAAHVEPVEEEVEYQPVDFKELSDAEPPDVGNLSLLLDVPLNITVELGRTRTNIKTILGYGQGSLLTLNKLAGEQVDLLVNGKPFARGEVVVVDENFGVRITSILTQEERIKQLIEN